MDNRINQRKQRLKPPPTQTFKVKRLTEDDLLYLAKFETPLTGRAALLSAIDHILSHPKTRASFMKELMFAIKNDPVRATKELIYPLLKMSDARAKTDSAISPEDIHSLLQKLDQTITKDSDSD